MKRLAELIILSLIWGLISISCRGEQEANDNTDINTLFKGTCKLTTVYIDSIKTAKDSAELESLMERYDVRVTELNFRVAADTDLRLSEGQNDTIIQLMDSIRKIYDVRRHFFAHHKEVVDTISPDTVINVNAIPPSGNSGNRISN